MVMMMMVVVVVVGVVVVTCGCGFACPVYSAADFDSAKPYLEKMGKKIVHCGEVGTGAVCRHVVSPTGPFGDPAVSFRRLHTVVASERRQQRHKWRTWCGQAWGSGDRCR